MAEQRTKTLERWQAYHFANPNVGFAVVGEYKDPKIQEAQKSAFDQMIAWLKSH